MTMKLTTKGVVVHNCYLENDDTDADADNDDSVTPLCLYMMWMTCVFGRQQYIIIIMWESNNQNKDEETICCILLVSYLFVL